MSPAAPREAKGHQLLIVRRMRALKARCTVGIHTFLRRAVSSEEINFSFCPGEQWMKAS